MEQDLQEFPRGSLVADGGTLTPEEDWFNIEVPLRPFPLDGETVTTSLRLDGIEFGTDDVSELAGRTFTFPVNPEEGYIDGSLYVRHVHCPADVTRIAFGGFHGAAIEATLTGRILFEFESTGFRDMDFELAARLTVATPPAV